MDGNPMRPNRARTFLISCSPDQEFGDTYLDDPVLAPHMKFIFKKGYS